MLAANAGTAVQIAIARRIIILAALRSTRPRPRQPSQLFRRRPDRRERPMKKDISTGYFCINKRGTCERKPWNFVASRVPHQRHDPPLSVPVENVALADVRRSLLLRRDEVRP